MTVSMSDDGAVERLTRATAEARRRSAARAAFDPRHAARCRHEAAFRGGVSTFDDPFVQVRCSDLEAVIAAPTGQPAAASDAADTDQLALFPPQGEQQ